MFGYSIFPLSFDFVILEFPFVAGGGFRFDVDTGFVISTFLFDVSFLVTGSSSVGLDSGAGAVPNVGGGRDGLVLRALHWVDHRGKSARGLLVLP